MWDAGQHSSDGMVREDLTLSLYDKKECVWSEFSRQEYSLWEDS